MSNFKQALAKALAVVVHYAFIRPYIFVRLSIRKRTVIYRIKKATRKAIELRNKDGVKRFVVPAGQRYLVLTRSELKQIVNEYRRRHGGKFISWQKFYIASTK